MNGIDPVVGATGNNWHSIEAGAHAFAVGSGRYTFLTRRETANERAHYPVIQAARECGTSANGGIVRKAVVDLRRSERQLSGLERPIEDADDRLTAFDASRGIA